MKLKRVVFIALIGAVILLNHMPADALPPPDSPIWIGRVIEDPWEKQEEEEKKALEESARLERERKEKEERERLDREQKRRQELEALAKQRAEEARILKLIEQRYELEILRQTIAQLEQKVVELEERSFWELLF